MSKSTEGREPNIQSVKGMRDIFDGDYYAMQGFFEKAAEIASYYGFMPIETPMLEQADLFIRGVGEGTDIAEKEMYTLRTKGGDFLALRPELTAPILRAYIEQGFQAQPQPVLLYSYGPAFRHEKSQRGRYRQFWQFDLEAIGTTKSIADALVIKLFMLILQEAGLKDLKLEINSLGDKECRPIFKRELVNYYKRHAKDVCEDCRERLKTNPLRVLDCKNPKCQELKAGAPSSIGYLCSACKAHFKEVLEYLESMGVAYEINPSIVRGLDYYTRTVFEVTEPAAPTQGGSAANGAAEEVAAPLALGGGGRYDGLARAIGHKKDIPAIGAGIGVDRVLLARQYARQTPRILKKPKVFFIQLSFDAKLKSLEVIEVLRKAKIPLAQTLAKDSLATQLGIAEKMGVPYVIILGQKEALEGTVIIRNMDTRSQDTVPVARLAEYIRHIKEK